jgi:glutaredoxin 3
MSARVMYVKPNCPYCEQARAALRERGDDFIERDATSRADWKAELMRHSHGTGMVPTIVLGDEVETVGWQGHG